MGVVFSGLAALVVEGVADEGGVIRVSARTREDPVPCPACGQPTERVHGFHGRVVADVPVDGRRVVVSVRVRRLVCPVLGCPRGATSGLGRGMGAAAGPRAGAGRRVRLGSEPRRTGRAVRRAAGNPLRRDRFPGQPRAAQGRRRDIAHRAINVRGSWDDMVDACHKGPGDPGAAEMLDIIWDEVITDLGSDDDAYSYVTHIGFAAELNTVAFSFQGGMRVRARSRTQRC